MSYLAELDDELKSAGIPSRRRTRIVTEFADHLHEDPSADLGDPVVLARQFADELGTRLARTVAYRAFAALALAGVFLTVLFFTGGRQHGWVGYAHYQYGLVAVWWWVPLQIVCTVSAQVALVSGLLAAIRAFRLRREPVITAADAAILNRRAAIGLVAGALALLVVPLTYRATSLGWPSTGIWWPATQYGGIAAIVVLLAMLPAVLSASRIRPSQDGSPSDLTTDLGMERAGLTPLRIAIVVSIAIFVVFTLIGIVQGNPYDGPARGVFDAAACMTGFIVLGPYLGLRATS